MRLRDDFRAKIFWNFLWDSLTVSASGRLGCMCWVNAERDEAFIVGNSHRKRIWLIFEAFVSGWIFGGFWMVVDVWVGVLLVIVSSLRRWVFLC